VAHYRIGVNVKLLEVLLKEVTIFQDTPWEKKGLGWDDFAAEFVRINPMNRVSKTDNTVDDITAKLNAWRKANPQGRPEAAWTALGGSGPAPEPVKTIKGRDLRRQPPDDSGEWIDFGDKWQNTKMTPTGFALKPNPDRPNTWGPKWVPAAEVIKAIKKEKKDISDAEVTTQVKAINNSQGQPRYSDQEIADAWETIKRHAILDKIHKSTETPKPIWDKKDKQWNCPKGWTYDPSKKACVEDEDEDEPPVPTPGEDGNPTCEKPWVYDPEKNACVREKTPPNNDTPPKPVKGSDGNFTCVAPWVYDEKTKSCVKKTETPVVVTPTPPKPVTGPDGKITCQSPFVYDEKTKSCVMPTTPPPKPNGEVTLQMPSGSISDINRDNPFGANGGKHKGIDIKVPVKTKVLAPEDGTITKLPREDKKGNAIFDDRGLFIEFTSTDGKRVHKFFHLSVLNDTAVMSASFSKGQTLALSGGAVGAYGAGNSKGPHLHWEVWVEETPVNPEPLVK
jgi:hypothetical protein